MQEYLWSYCNQKVSWVLVDTCPKQLRIISPKLLAFWHCYNYTIRRLKTSFERLFEEIQAKFEPQRGKFKQLGLLDRSIAGKRIWSCIHFNSKDILWQVCFQLLKNQCCHDSSLARTCYLWQCQDAQKWSHVGLYAQNSLDASILKHTNGNQFRQGKTEELEQLIS
jgi:hypothetical protein